MKALLLGAALAAGCALVGAAGAQNVAQIDEPGFEWNPVMYLSQPSPVVTASGDGTMNIGLVHPGDDFVTVGVASSSLARFMTHPTTGGVAGPAIGPVLQISFAGAGRPAFGKGADGRSILAADATALYRLELDEQGTITQTRLGEGSYAPVFAPRFVLESPAEDRIYSISGSSSSGVRVLDAAADYATTATLSYESPLSTIWGAGVASDGALFLADQVGNLIRLAPPAEPSGVWTQTSTVLTAGGGTSQTNLVIAPDGRRVFVALGDSLQEVPIEESGAFGTASNLQLSNPSISRSAWAWNSVDGHPVGAGLFNSQRAQVSVRSIPATGAAVQDVVNSAWEADLRTAGAIAFESTAGRLFVAGIGASQGDYRLAAFERSVSHDGRMYVQELRTDETVELTSVYAYLAGGAGSVRFRVYRQTEEVWVSAWIPVEEPGRFSTPVPPGVILTPIGFKVAVEIQGDCRPTFSSSNGTLGTSIILLSSGVPLGTEATDQFLVSSGATSPAALAAGIGFRRPIPVGELYFATSLAMRLEDTVYTSTDELRPLLVNFAGTQLSAIQVSTRPDFVGATRYELNYAFENMFTSPSFSYPVADQPEGPGFLYARPADSDSTITAQASFFIDRVAPEPPTLTLTTLTDPSGLLIHRVSWPADAVLDPAPSSGISGLAIEYRVGSNPNLLLQPLVPTATSFDIELPDFRAFSARLVVTDEVGNEGRSPESVDYLPAAGTGEEIFFATAIGVPLENTMYTATNMLPSLRVNFVGEGPSAVEVSASPSFEGAVQYPLTADSETLLTTSYFEFSVADEPEGPGFLYARPADSDSTITAQASFFIDRVAPQPPLPVLTVLPDVHGFRRIELSWPADAVLDPTPSSGIDSLAVEYRVGAIDSPVQRQPLQLTDTSFGVTIASDEAFRAQLYVVDSLGNEGRSAGTAEYTPPDPNSPRLYRQVQDPSADVILLSSALANDFIYELGAAAVSGIQLSTQPAFDTFTQVLFGPSGTSSTYWTNIQFEVPATPEGPGTIYTRALLPGGGFGYEAEFSYFLDQQEPFAPPAAPVFEETTNGQGGMVVRVTLPDTSGTLRDPEPSSGVRILLLEYFPSSSFGAGSGTTVELDPETLTVDIPSQFGNALYGTIRWIDAVGNWGEPSPRGYLLGNSEPPTFANLVLVNGFGSSDPQFPAIGTAMRLQGFGTGLVEYFDVSLSPDMSDAVRIPTSPSNLLVFTNFNLATPFQVVGSTTAYFRPGNTFLTGNGLSTIRYRFDDQPPLFDGPLSIERPSAVAGRLEFRIPAANDPQPGSFPSLWAFRLGTSAGASDLRNESVSNNGARPGIITVTGIAAGTTLYARYRVSDTVGNSSGWVTADPFVYTLPPAAQVQSITPAEPLTRHDLTAVYTVMDPEGALLESETRWLLAGQPTAVSGPVVPAALTSKGQQWEFQARGRDALGWGPWAGLSTTIANTPPTEPFVEIRPRIPNPGQDLIVNVLTYSTDEDGDSVGYDFAWYKSTDNGQTFIRKVELDGSPQVSNLFIDTGDVWEVVYTPFERNSKRDGAKSVTAVSARDRVYVGANQLPEVTVARPLIRQQAGGTARLIGSFTATDPDNDLTRIVISWSDRLQSGLTTVGELAPGAAAYDIVGTFPTDRAVYVHVAAYDSKGALRQVYSAPAALGSADATGLMLH